MGRGLFIEGCKNVEDVKCVKVFIKFICEIIVVICVGVVDLVGNLCLCVVVDKVLLVNMFKDIIECVIKCGLGVDGGVNMEDLCYEGYGLVGIVLIIECFIDNLICIVVDVCYVLICYGGNLGISGLVVFQFICCGEIVFVIGGNEVVEEKVLEVVLEVGVDDVVNEYGESIVLCVLENFEVVQQVLIVVGLEFLYVGVVMCLNNCVVVLDEVQEMLQDLFECFDVFDDVSEVYYNVLLLVEVVG